MSEEVSTFFDAAFLGCGGGTPVAECSCGRTTYCDSDHYEDGEREELDLQRAGRPGQVFYIEEGSVGVYEVLGATFVFGCPCDGLRRLEERIWKHRNEISRYLTARARAQLEDAQSVLDDLSREGA